MPPEVCHLQELSKNVTGLWNGLGWFLPLLPISTVGDRGQGTGDILAHAQTTFHTLWVIHSIRLGILIFLCFVKFYAPYRSIYTVSWINGWEQSNDIKLDHELSF
uniref:Uncharacterized protein n=1 Tax=Salvator merianae TaxID=96440 RepID=A0A8D0BJI2_SALMN